MNTFTAVHITFGRNVNTVPMSDEKWADFIETVKKDLVIVMTVLGTPDFPIEVHTGTGSYNGVSEDSAKVSTYFEYEMPDSFYDVLVSCLSETAGMFGQESIALSVGPSTLVFP